MILYLLCVLIFAKGIHSGGLREDTIPSKPTLMVEASDTSFLVRWLPPADYQSTLVRGYKLSYGKRVPDENVIDTNANTFSVTISDLEPETSYIFRLEAYNNIGQGLPAYHFDTTLARKVGSTPDPGGDGSGLLTPPIINTEPQSSDSVLVSWTGIQGATDGRYYTVRYKTKPPSSWKSEDTTETSYLVTGLEPDTLYEFAVKVVRGSESSLNSISEFARTQEGVPSNETTTNPAGGSCEPITVPFCSGGLVPYNHTILPNLFGQTNQSLITDDMQAWLSVAVTGCAPLINFFLCAVYVPVCTVLELPIPPCREVCNMIQNDCQAAIDANPEFTWPEELTCDDFPKSGSSGDLCIGPDMLPPGGSIGPGGGGPFGPGGQPESCEVIESVPQCDPTVYREIPYNLTMFPNILGHESQDEAGYYSLMFESLIDSGCSPLLRFFMCSALLPVCSVIPVPLPPCKEMCELPRDQCRDEMESQGFTWPEELACENLPAAGPGVLCIGFSAENVTTEEPSSEGDGEGEGMVERPDVQEGTATCEPLTDAAKELCPGIEYTETIFPNTLGHRDQEEAIDMLTMHTSIMGIGCPIGQFLCVLAFPPCKRFGDSEESAVPLLPCREECAYVEESCMEDLNEAIQGINSWSTEWKCDNFPEYNSEPPLCWEITNGFLREKPTEPEVPSAVCSSDIPAMCQDLGFKTTSYPNIFDHANSTYAMEIIEELQPLLDSGCSEELSAFICAAHFPVCDVNGTAILPCHEACRRVWKTCKESAELLGIDRPKVFSCGKNYPASKDGAQCLWSFSAPSTPPKVKSIKRKPESAEIVLLPEDIEAKFFNMKIFGPDKAEDKKLGVVSGDKSTTAVIDELAPGNTYYATIQTENDFGESPIIVETIPKHEGIQCQPLEIEMCQGLGYDMGLADGHLNRFGHIDQAEAFTHLEQFQPLIQVGCSPDIKRFLCWVFAPGCSPDVDEVMSPCRESCESARFGCETLMQAFGFEWPDILECDQFPYKNESSLCEAGSQLSYWGTQGSDGSDYHCMKLFESGPQPKWYDPQGNEISEDPDQPIYSTVLSARMIRLQIAENTREVSGNYTCKFGDFKTQTEIFPQGGSCYNNYHPVCSKYFDHYFLPNTMNHTDESEALLSMNAFLPLMATDCSEYLSLFACYLNLPRSGCGKVSNETNGFPDDVELDKVGFTDGPCRELCWKAQSDCADVIDELGFLWPETASCENLPPASDNTCDSFGISEMDLIQGTVSPDENATEVEFVTEVTDLPDTNVTEIYPTDFTEGTEGPLPTAFTEFYTDSTELSNVTEEVLPTDGFNDTDVTDLPAGTCDGLKPRRYDIEDLGSECLFRGWADVQAQGAANDYCRVVTNGGPKFLSCALAGASDDHVYTSPNASVDWFDAGHTDTWYMKDEDGDGRDDYCRCVGVPPDTFMSCMKADESGFIGHDDFQIDGITECEYNKVNPFFGAP